MHPCCVLREGKGKGGGYRLCRSGGERRRLGSKGEHDDEVAHERERERGGVTVSMGDGRPGVMGDWECRELFLLDREWQTAHM